MSKTPAEIYQAMNATNILVAILESQKKVSIPIDVFLILTLSRLAFRIRNDKLQIVIAKPAKQNCI
jgi:hypothetical protein